MKKLSILLICSFALLAANAQSTYYKGEWTKSLKQDLFTGVFKITINGKSEISGELLWTYVATDSNDNKMTSFYNGKKGKMGIEYVEGTLDPITRDIYLEGKSKDDPNDIIGLDKYTLKFSVDRQVIYGKTDSNGANDGMFYGTKMDATKGQQTILAAKKKIRLSKD